MKSEIFNKKYDEVFVACKKALQNLEMTIEIEDKLNKTITCSVQTSFLSWGENVQINFEMVNQFSTRIEVESNSQAQLISWGKNEENEEKIISQMRQIL